ncbi:decapping endonuclease targeting mRNA [Tulasnella sp. 403]|nr:decapping endonuclease targeting mRNA [Tulasnella sp. 403]
MARQANDIFPLPNTKVSDPPTFQRPLALLTFSYTPSRTLVFDNSAMRYYKDPPIGARLDRDYENWIKRPEERTRLDALLQCLERDEAKAEAQRAQLVTWRGIMTKYVNDWDLRAMHRNNIVPRIIIAPQEFREGWELNVMLVDGKMFLEEHVSESKLNEKEALSGDQRLFTYYGYAFESYCTTENAPEPEGQAEAPGWGGRVDTNVQWCAVVKTKLSDVRMILGAEVDCVRGEAMLHTAASGH